ncbi:hypothetical protein ACIBL3_18825 [Kribbella sp. NPDC050124]|uniref:hypothetical protein n=1 Tax=Kribbella sp. NPDC050124 TaxID=3364114 RepID=UPI00378E7076
MPVRGLITVAVALSATLVPLQCETVDTPSRSTTSSRSPAREPSARAPSAATSRAVVKITASDSVCWSGQLGTRSRRGCGSATIQIKDSNGTYTVYLVKSKGAGTLNLTLAVNGRTVQRGSMSGSTSVVSISYASS